MIIKRLTATFGKLKNETLELSPGLNVITAPNESGKSTWCAFIRAMLYGVPTSDRDKAGYMSDKTRYRPWDGGAMEGVMELSCGLGDITLERTASARAPMKDLRVTYTGTGDAVPGLTAETAGEALTGVPEAVFRRSAFIAQSGIRVDQTPELERRIAALVSTGDEQTSYSEADERLREWQRRRKFKRSGEIPRLEERIAALDGELRRMEEAFDSTAGLRLEVAELSERQSALERELRHHDSCDAAAKARRVDDALRGRTQALRSHESRLEDVKRRREEAEQELRDATKRCESSVYNGYDTDKILSDAERMHRRAGGKPLAIVLTVILMAAFALTFIPGLNAGQTAALAAVGIVSAVWRLTLLYRSQKLKALLISFELSEIGELRGGIREYEALEQAQRDAENALSEADRALENAVQMYDSARESLAEAEAIAREYAGTHEPDAPAPDPVITPSRLRAQSQAEFESVTVLLARRRSECDMAQGAIRAIGDPAVLRGVRLELEAELSEKTLQSEALTMAVDALAEANARMQARFAPMLGREAERLLSRMTAGRYDGLVFDRSLTASAREAGAAVSRDVLALSAGTVDQIYLALRLAVLKLVTPGHDPCPVILDDALCNFDDERAVMALGLLREISQERQVILFTCHEREARTASAD